MADVTGDTGADAANDSTPVECPPGLDKEAFDPDTTLFVRNLSFDADEDAIVGFFSQHGVEVTHCHVERNSNGRAAGFAYIQLGDVEAATNTLTICGAAEKAAEECGDGGSGKRTLFLTGVPMVAI